MKKITLLLLVISYVSFGQNYTYIDFGITTNETAGNWNNVSVPNAADASGITLALIDSDGASTGVTLTVDDAFDTVNTAGNATPDPSLPFPSSAAADSFFGETSTFGGTLEPTGGFTLSGLDPTKYYAFSIFASRNGVSDNRETQFTVVGSTTQVVAMNPSNNTTDTADVLNIQSNASGEISLTAEPGPNNTNGTGFYYLGAIEMVTSDTPLSAEDFNLLQALQLYPNPVVDALDIKMDLAENAIVQLNIIDVNGRLISNLFNGEHEAGKFHMTWDTSIAYSKITPGVYFLKIQVNNNTVTKKLLIN